MATHGDTTVSHGTVQDGVGAATLIDYLQRDVAAASTDGVLVRFGEAPTVRYVEGTSAGQVDEIVGAVRLINANLPRNFQLTVDSSPVTAAADAAGTAAATLAAGQILVEYDRSGAVKAARGGWFSLTRRRNSPGPAAATTAIAGDGRTP